MSDEAAPERFQFKIVLRQVSPMVWRRVVVPSALTLADLHEVIQVAMGWDDEHLHRFHVHGRDHALSRPSVAGCGDPRGTRLVDLRLRVGERFTYEYNFHGPWMHDLRLQAKLPPDPKRSWPETTKESGVAEQ